MDEVSRRSLAMSSKTNRDTSIGVTAFYMKITGFWLANNSNEERRRKFATICTVFALATSIVVEVRDFYFTWGDFSNCIYIACNIASVAIGLFKISVSIRHKKEILNLVLHAEANFWHSNYDHSEQLILDSYSRICIVLICIFNFFAEGTVAFYIVRPLLANAGKNETERILPFNMWINAPLSMTPYFELTFVFQIFCLCYVGVCYLCFDNFLCVLNLQTASQFRILQHRLRSIFNMKNVERSQGMVEGSKSSTNEYYKAFRKCIQQHQMLIEYSNELEKVFTSIVLGQVLLFSLLICLDGYLVLMDDTSGVKRINFVFHITGCMVQLLMFTYSCDCLQQESSNVSYATYESPWTRLPMDKNGRIVRQDLILVIMRSQLPCCLTACGFFPVSLETYTTVLSSAMTYFTLLTHY